jgi:hypothetical protein
MAAYAEITCATATARALHRPRLFSTTHGVAPMSQKV